MRDVASQVHLTADIETMYDETSRQIMHQLFVLGLGWQGVVATFGHRAVALACTSLVNKCLSGGHAPSASYQVITNDPDAAL